MARDKNRAVLIEATSNQVNQFGGYSGMKPKQFIALVQNIVREIRIDSSLVLFGGDHLGPQTWRSESAVVAMAKAEAMIRSFVDAGFTKIHLDCSEGCAGEPAQVGETVAAKRAAHLAKICEATASHSNQLTYVIGTEVPAPGGARLVEEDQAIKPTESRAIKVTIETHRRAFNSIGSAAIWPRVLGLVVQPGLEFSPTSVDQFDLSSTDSLSPTLENYPNICFEAHSTDFQKTEVFPELASRGFSVLKVGPALTFAYRQAVYALDNIRAVLDSGPPTLMNSIERIMINQPRYWQNHYSGSEDELRLLRHFSYADRIRYYWPAPNVQNAIKELFAALGSTRPPDPLIGQYFSPEVVERADQLMSTGQDWSNALVLGQIQQALSPYFF